MREKSVARKFNKIIDAGLAVAKGNDGRNRLEEVQFYPGVVEPGYDDVPTALGNWNRIDHYDGREFVTDDDVPVRVSKALEKAGINLEWSDEWTVCNDCGRLVRTQPDSYGWTRSYWEDENGVQCAECCEKDPSAYLESLEGNERHCVTFDVDLEGNGYRLLEDGFENGLYGGQDADPKAIAKSLREQGVERFIFKLDSVGQFDARFSVWVHEDDLPKIDKAKWEGQPKSAAEDPAEVLKRGLQASTAALASLPDGPGVKIATINSDGSADARLVSPEEFVKGVKP